MRALDGVDGWLWPDEAWTLHELARTCPAVGGRCIVEIGAWHGRSTIALTAGALHRPAPLPPVWSIDHHTGSEEHRIRAGGPVSTFPAWEANLERAGVRSAVNALVMDCHEACRRFPPASIGLCFLDGSHDLISVRRDLADWYPLLVPGGMLVVDDVGYPPIVEALGERGLDPDRAPVRVGKMAGWLV